MQLDFSLPLLVNFLNGKHHWIVLRMSVSNVFYEKKMILFIIKQKLLFPDLICCPFLLVLFIINIVLHDRTLPRSDLTCDGATRQITSSFRS